MDTSPSEVNDDRMHRQQIIEASDRRWQIAAAGVDRRLLERLEAPKLLTTRPLSVTETGAEVRCPWCTGLHHVHPSLLGATVTAPCGRGELTLVREIADR